jgi:hypothetical protein
MAVLDGGSWSQLRRQEKNVIFFVFMIFCVTNVLLASLGRFWAQPAPQARAGLYSSSFEEKAADIFEKKRRQDLKNVF